MGEFTFEIWVKPDRSFPIGPVWRGTKAQMVNWAEYDNKPYASDSWWLVGNWLVDGFSRPHGFDAGDSREGSFGLQFYGGGRIRWMFADADLGMPTGKVWAVEVYPAAQTPSLLDDRWHSIACVRRWREPEGAALELWVDGKMIAHEDIPNRIDMRRFWDALPHPNNPKELRGWAIGSEVMTAWDYYFNQYEDYKGLVDEIRFWSRARSASELSNDWRRSVDDRAPGLVAHFAFDEGEGDIDHDQLDPRYQFRLHRRQPDSWSPDNAPLDR
jgi:hypothetical protein